VAQLMDDYSRFILGWNIAERHDGQLIHKSRGSIYPYAEWEANVDFVAKS